MSSRDILDSRTQEARHRNEKQEPDLHFLPDTVALRTPFRDSALNYIHQTALELADGRLESAVVEFWSYPNEEDSEILDLTLTVDGDWEFIKELRDEILVKLSEWSRDLSQEQMEDYGRRIYFGLLPSTL